MDKTKLMTFNDEIDYMFHSNIVECDMVSASVSVCERYKLLDAHTIEWLRLLPKERRTREMGMMQKNSEFSKKMIDGLLETREIFIMKNKIQDENILSLHSDALFFNTCGRDIIMEVNGIKFAIKHEYTSYMKYDKRIEMFYTGETVDFKQIPQDLINQHTLGINKHIRKVFEMVENYDEDVLSYLKKFETRYLRDEFESHYYQSFGKYGDYKTENLKLFSFITKVVLKEIKEWRSK